MDLFDSAENKARKLAIEDYVGKYHRMPNLKLVKKWLDKTLMEVHLIYKADDMAFYSFCYWAEPGKNIFVRGNMRTFYRDGVKEWTESETDSL